MVEHGSSKGGCYEPGPAFEEITDELVLDVSLTDSTELWLIQWPINQLQLADLHGKELSLKLHDDGNLGSLESTSGKSYELVSFAAQDPDATVFLPSGSEIKVAGKISRRVCLARYPEPEELEKEAFSNLNLSSQRSAGSSRKGGMSRFPGTPTKHQSTQGSALSLGQGSRGPTPKHKKRREGAGGSMASSEMDAKSAEGSRASGTESNTTLETEQSHLGKPKKKKVKIEE